MPLVSASTPSRTEPGGLGLSAAEAGTASAARAATASAIRVMVVPPGQTGPRNVLEASSIHPDAPQGDLMIRMSRRAILAAAGAFALRARAEGAPAVPASLD